MLEKCNEDKELARRLCAAFLSNQLGVTVATQYKNTPEDVGDLWYFLAAFSRALAGASLDADAPYGYEDLRPLATTIIQ